MSIAALILYISYHFQLRSLFDLASLDGIHTVIVDGNKARNGKQDKHCRDARWLKIRKTIQDLQWLKLLAAIVNDPTMQISAK